MKKLLPLILVLLTVSNFCQTSDLAVGTYAENGKLISLTNLLGLSDCESKNVMGKVTKVKVRKNLAYVRLRASDKTRNNIEIHLDKLSAADRAIIFFDLVRKPLILRVGGYSCNASAAIAAFSIDRVY